MNDAKKERGRISPIDSGLKGRCPRCGEGKLFAGYLTLAKSCSKCGLDFDFADAGDGPAVFVMFPVGFIVVFLALVVEVNFQPPYWLHALLWLPLTLILSLLLLRPFKGVLVNLQYHHDAKEARLDDEDDV